MALLCCGFPDAGTAPGAGVAATAERTHRQFETGRF